MLTSKHHLLEKEKLTLKAFQTNARYLNKTRSELERCDSCFASVAIQQPLKAV